MTDREIEKRMTDKEITESVNRAFKQMGREKAAREQARKSSADSARERMIRRQTGKDNSKEKTSGTSKIPLWSN